MLDGADFAGRQFAADGEDDRGRGVLALAAEQLALGQDEVDAGALDAGERGDGAGQFAFEGAHIVDVLDEARGAQRRSAGRRFRSRPGRGCGRPFSASDMRMRGDLVAGDEDGVAFAAQFVGDVLGLQLGDDRRRVLEAQAGIERRHLRGRGPHDEEGEEAQHQHGDDGHGGDARQTEAVENCSRPFTRAPGRKLPRGRQRADHPHRQKLPSGW